MSYSTVYMCDWHRLTLSSGVICYGNTPTIDQVATSRRGPAGRLSYTHNTTNQRTNKENPQHISLPLFSAILFTNIPYNIHVLS